jgi:multicomponent Na+:H+ antiporter subunit G
MAEAVSLLLLLVGAGFTLVAAMGVGRMPDLFTRLHCSTKSATLGVGCMALGAAIYFGEIQIWARALAIVGFLFATTPVAAHMIGRAAYFARVVLWEGTLQDELRDQYDLRTHALASDLAPPPHGSDLSPPQESNPKEPRRS